MNPDKGWTKQDGDDAQPMYSVSDSLALLSCTSHTYNSHINVHQVGTKQWNDAALVPARQGTQAAQHWKKAEPELIKGLWTPEEDSRLRNIKLGDPNLSW